jgi:hypothetical protein
MEVSVQPEDMKLLVILIFAGALERNLDYGSDNFRNFVANGKIKKTGQLSLFRQIAGTNRKTPA